MSGSFVLFLVSLILIERIRRFSKREQINELFRNFQLLLYICISFYLFSNLLHEKVTRWIWVIGLGCLLYYCFNKNQLQTQRKLFWAAVPILVASVISNISWLISASFYKEWKVFYDNAEGVAFIWMLAILFSQNKLNKQLEKERKERKEEEARNRAIALRKVELEVLVQERTAEISKQKEELEKTVEELKSTQQQLIQSEKMASLGELTAGIAHEIQNPLNFVNNFSELNNELLQELGPLDKLGVTADQQDILKDIQSNSEKINHHGQRAASIVKGMLQHSRSSSGQKEPTDINALCDEYLRLAYHGLRAKDKSFNAEFKTEFDETLPKVNIVPQDMGRVILNLINNAFFAVSERVKIEGGSHKAEAISSEEEGIPSGLQLTPYSPIVTVSTKNLGNKIEINISDNGTGIPNDIKEKIFQPFFTTKPTGQGTGLGLSLAYDIVTKLHGGKLTVESEQGSGTTFIISIPS
ncbi:MAG: histidine kinase [Chitinophagaceae bacterium]|nr:histidine kinase [Chitinophagaceae bacterium]